MKKEKIIISIILILLGVAYRLIPHAWNFAPITAIALFSGVYLGRNYAISLPIIAMLIGDLFIGFYEWRLQLFVYASYLIIGLLGCAIRKNKNLYTIICGSVLASIIFFVGTNWAVWQFSPWYEKSIAGLIECYAMALPFFRNTLLGDLFYTGVLFGAYEAIVILARQKKSLFKTN